MREQRGKGVPGKGCRPQHGQLCLSAWPSGFWEGPLLLPYCPLWPPEPYEAQQAEPIAYFQGLRLVMSHGPYVKLITGFLFTSLAFMVSGGVTCLAREGVVMGMG